MLNQPNNKPLINYIFNKMDLKLWQPFLFEIMVFAGKILGTQDAIFQRLFKEKAYLMGKILTVESRIKSFN